MTTRKKKPTTKPELLAPEVETVATEVAIPHFPIVGIGASAGGLADRHRAD